MGARAHVNHIFSAGMSSSQRAESAHAFFKRYVNKENSLVNFMIQYGRGLVHQRNKELMTDHKDMIEKHKMKMLHHFLVHMVGVYTFELFFIFQEELCMSFNYKFELIGENDDCHLYKVQNKMVEKSRVREILYQKSLDLASCICKKIESLGIPCRHILAYLNKMHDFNKLSDQYILKRWCKTAKSRIVIDDGGMEITDDKSYLMKRSELIQMYALVVSRALGSKEATKVYTDALESALVEINKLVIGCGTSSQTSSQMFGCGTSVGGSRKKGSNMENSFYEPNHVRPKGCGKRLKGLKEKALRKVQKYHGRKYSGCGQVGQHDKRICPKLINLEQPFMHDDDTTQNCSTDDESYSSLGNGNRLGYGSTSYNANTKYELASQWSTPSVGGSVAVGSRGYGGYSGIDGSYACPRSYGVVGEQDVSTRNSNSIGEGGEQHGSSVGHMGNDYDANYGYRNTYN